MYTVCVVAMCCAFFPCGSAAPKSGGAEPRSHFDSKVEQNAGLQEEIDGQENILSKVGGNVHFYFIASRVLWTIHYFVRKSSNVVENIRPLLFVAAG